MRDGFEEENLKVGSVVFVGKERNEHGFCLTKRGLAVSYCQ